jgi:hypothetical protein
MSQFRALCLRPSIYLVTCLNPVLSTGLVRTFAALFRDGQIPRV